MFLESEAPFLPGLAELREFMADKNIAVRREYMLPWEDPETGEELEGYWQVMMMRECKMKDGRIWMRMIHVSDHSVMKMMSFPELRDHELKLLEMAWERDMEKIECDG